MDLLLAGSLTVRGLSSILLSFISLLRPLLFTLRRGLLVEFSHNG
jgi:hypothetical protein